ncbi:MAG: alpha/beta fold hydrolase [Propylenella sp.]
MAEEHFIEAGDNRLHAVVEGAKGAPWLTCLHTLASNLSLWDDQAPALGKSFRLLKLDARGHGRSNAERPAASLDDLVADVVSVWDALGVERSLVLGISLGGMTGVGLALTHPTRVTKLVAADCRLDSPAFFVDMWTQRMKQLREDGLATVADVTMPIWFTEKTRKERPEIVARARAMIVGTSEAGYVGAGRALQKLDYKRRLGEIRCPTLFVVGELDGPHPNEIREFAKMAPGARFVEIAGVAHASNLEAPERFTEIVLDFLKS